MRGRGSAGGLSARWALLVLVVGTAFAMLTAEPGWTGSWRQAVDNAVGTVVITGPLLAGIVAGTYASLRRTALADLVVSSARPWRGWTAPVLRYVGAGVVALAAVLVVVTVRAAFQDVPLPARQLVIVPVGVLVLGVHGLVGMVIGLRTSPRVAPVLAALTSFGLFLLATDHLAPPSFVPGGVTGSMYGEQYRLVSVLALCAFAVASAAVLAPWAGWDDRRQRRRWAASLAAAAVILGLAHQTWPDLEARLEPTPVAYRCGGSAPEVCVVAERPSDDLESIARRMGELAAPLRATGATLPTRWRHDLYGQPRDAGAGKLVMTVDAEVGGEVDDATLLRSLVEPADCPQYAEGNEPADAFRGRVQIMHWLTFRNALDPRAKFGPWFSTKASDAWVRTTYEQLRRCDLGAVRKP